MSRRRRGGGYGEFGNGRVKRKSNLRPQEEEMKGEWGRGLLGKSTEDLHLKGLQDSSGQEREYREGSLEHECGGPFTGGAQVKGGVGDRVRVEG